ncbi:MAG: CRISPR-associated protein Cas2 [Maribacter sp.]|uniref:CRISPR-associated protein Cas2 n=1 Tax=Maribacter sp. TaxID=1897614 RepID=UPI003298FCD7
MKKSYLIGYDLNKSGQDYKTLIEQIKKLGNWWHCLDSTFIVKSSSTASLIRDHLKKFIDSNDELLILCLTGEGAWTGFSKECSDWLRKNL